MFHVIFFGFLEHQKKRATLSQRPIPRFSPGPVGNWWIDTFGQRLGGAFTFSKTGARGEALMKNCTRLHWCESEEMVVVPQSMDDSTVSCEKPRRHEEGIQALFDDSPDIMEECPRVRSGHSQSKVGIATILWRKDQGCGCSVPPTFGRCKKALFLEGFLKKIHDLNEPIYWVRHFYDINWCQPVFCQFWCCFAVPINAWLIAKWHGLQVKFHSQKCDGWNIFNSTRGEGRCWGFSECNFFIS